MSIEVRYFQKYKIVNVLGQIYYAIAKGFDSALKAAREEDGNLVNIASVVYVGWVGALPSAYENKGIFQSIVINAKFIFQADSEVISFSKEEVMDCLKEFVCSGSFSSYDSFTVKFIKDKVYFVND